MISEYFTEVRRRQRRSSVGGLLMGEFSPTHTETLGVGLRKLKSPAAPGLQTLSRHGSHRWLCCSRSPRDLALPSFLTLAAPFENQSLHSGTFKLFAKLGCDSANWGRLYGHRWRHERRSFISSAPSKIVFQSQLSPPADPLGANSNHTAHQESGPLSSSCRLCNYLGFQIGLVCRRC